MSERMNYSLRIDELLLRDGLVSEDQIRDALEHQREHGGKLGSHLLKLGYISESELLTALAMQINCQSVILSDVEIPPYIAQMIPANVAIARNVVPFAYDATENTVKVACEDPNDLNLINELNFVIKDKKVNLYIAAEGSLRDTVARLYVSAMKQPVTEAVVDETGEVHLVTEGEEDIPLVAGSTLLVSDEPQTDRQLKKSLQDEGFEVTHVETADDAMDLIGKARFETVLIRDSVRGDYLDLIDRLRKDSPPTNVRFFESPAQLLLKAKEVGVVGDMLLTDLQLFTTLLCTKEGLEENHAGTVGQYVDKLCRKLRLPDKDRLTVTNAAYLHDLARFYYGESESARDCHARIPLTVKLLKSLNYSPLVIGILKSMYINLRQKYTKRLPIETLGGNILTIVDIFCDNQSLDTRMSLDRFEIVRKSLVAQSGKLFLREIVDAFVQMIEDEILVEPTGERFNQALVYCDDMDQMKPIVDRLKDDGFRPVALDALGRLVELYKRSQPDIIILVEAGRAGKAIALVEELIRRGVEVVKVPTFIVASQEVISELTSLFERGIEDIVPIESSLDILAVKMRKLRSRAQQRAGANSHIGGTSVTSGNLSDMNLIDLLQAMGPSGKTAKIRITDQSNELVLYLDGGQIIYAKGLGLQGADAVYAAMRWTDGQWIVQPIDPSKLPTPNNQMPNEAILMEGCRRLDESTRIPIAR